MGLEVVNVTSVEKIYSLEVFPVQINDRIFQTFYNLMRAGWRFHGALLSDIFHIALLIPI